MRYGFKYLGGAYPRVASPLPSAGGGRRGPRPLPDPDPRHLFTLECGLYIKH